MQRSEHTATVKWQRQDQVFSDNRYSRDHLWCFDGGTQVRASSSPRVVPVPLSVEENVDPEEAFVASLSSCHMLFFLSIAVKKGFIVDVYTDHACGILETDQNRKTAITEVYLRPSVRFSGDILPTRDQQQAMHQHAHKLCFIANSVKSRIIIEPGEA